MCGEETPSTISRGLSTQLVKIKLKRRRVDLQVELDIVNRAIEVIEKDPTILNTLEAIDILRKAGI